MVTLSTLDNKTFEVKRDVAERSALIRNMLEDLGESNQIIPLPAISSKVLEKIIEYCEHHRGDPLPAEDVEFYREDILERATSFSDWDRKFMKLESDLVFEIILAANYLDIKPLLDLGCMTVADMIRGKSPEEIQTLFDITNDLTPEEQAQIKKENEWAEPCDPSTGS